MPESFTPREINDYINSHNTGPRFDPYGSEELSNRLRATQAEGGDIFAQTQHSIDEDKAIEAKKEQARQALANFRSYLEQSDGKANNALPSDDELEYTYNPDTQDCEITRRDGAPLVLDISWSGLTGELPLPSQLMVTELDCHLNQLTSLPAELPKSLTKLDCSHTKLTSLPAELPKSLTALDCSENELTSLPDKLPDGLTELDCHLTKLTSLPDKLPDSLTEVWCYGNPDLRGNPSAQAALQSLRDRGVKVTSW